jgi:hypothetical protein
MQQVAYGERRRDLHPPVQLPIPPPPPLSPLPVRRFPMDFLARRDGESTLRTGDDSLRTDDDTFRTDDDTFRTDDDTFRTAGNTFRTAAHNINKATNDNLRTNINKATNDNLRTNINNATNDNLRTNNYFNTVILPSASNAKKRNLRSNAGSNAAENVRTNANIAADEDTFDETITVIEDYPPSDKKRSRKRGGRISLQPKKDKTKRAPSRRMALRNIPHDFFKKDVLGEFKQSYDLLEADPINVCHSSKTYLKVKLRVAGFDVAPYGDDGCFIVKVTISTVHEYSMQFKGNSAHIPAKLKKAIIIFITNMLIKRAKAKTTEKEVSQVLSKSGAPCSVHSLCVS